MAKNEPNKPDEVKTAPAPETTAEEKSTSAPMPEIGGEAPAPEKTTEKAATLLHEDEATPDKINKDRQEEPTPIDIPAPGDVVVYFDKINEIVSGKQAAVKEAEQTVPEKQEVEKSALTEKTAKPEKTSPDKKNDSKSKTADKADKKPSRPAKQEKAKALKLEKPYKPKQDAEIGSRTSASPQATEQVQQETPPSAPEMSPEPREAPRPGEQEQIVYLNLSELFAFKDHSLKSNIDHLLGLTDVQKNKEMER